MPPREGRELAFQMRLAKTGREEQLRRIAMGEAGHDGRDIAVGRLHDLNTAHLCIVHCMHKKGAVW